jgi:predicted DNA binding protein
MVIARNRTVIGPVSVRVSTPLRRHNRGHYKQRAQKIKRWRLNMLTLLVATFVIAYAAIALEHPLKINKSASALIGADHLTHRDRKTLITHVDSGFFDLLPQLHSGQA